MSNRNRLCNQFTEQARKSIVGKQSRRTRGITEFRGPSLQGNLADAVCAAIFFTVLLILYGLLKICIFCEYSP